MDLLSGMNKLAEQLDRVLVCYQKRGSNEHKFVPFDNEEDAEEYFKSLGPANQYSYKFYAYGEQDYDKM